MKITLQAERNFRVPRRIKVKLCMSSLDEFIKDVFVKKLTKVEFVLGLEANF